MSKMLSEHHCVKLVPIFHNLSDEQLSDIQTIAHHKEIPANTTLFNEGSEIDSLMIVAKGQIKVVKTAANGKEQLLYLLQTGDINNESALFNQEVHSSTAQTLTPTTVCLINRSDFQQLLLSSPQISMNVLNTLGSQLIDFEKQTTRSNTTSVAERLSEYLVETAAALNQNPFELPLKNKDLAALLGTSPETISRYLKKWDDQNLITKMDHHQIKIDDTDALLLKASEN